MTMKDKQLDSMYITHSFRTVHILVTGLYKSKLNVTELLAYSTMVLSDSSTVIKCVLSYRLYSVLFNFNLLLMDLMDLMKLTEVPAKLTKEQYTIHTILSIQPTRV